MIVDALASISDSIFTPENLGYFDDGEEHVGVVDDAYEGALLLSPVLI